MTTRKKALSTDREIFGGGPVNLDTMNHDELWEFFRKHNCGRGSRSLFKNGGRGTVAATLDLANYACNRAVAMRCRTNGDVASAKMYERICDRIYDGLPKWAKW